MHAGVSAAAGADGVCANALHTDAAGAGAEARVVSAARRLRGDFSNQDDFSKQGMAELPEVHELSSRHDARTGHIAVSYKYSRGTCAVLKLRTPRPHSPQELKCPKKSWSIRASPRR